MPVSRWVLYPITSNIELENLNLYVFIIQTRHYSLCLAVDCMLAPIESVYEDNPGMLRHRISVSTATSNHVCQIQHFDRWPRASPTPKAVNASALVSKGDKEKQVIGFDLPPPPTPSHRVKLAINSWIFNTVRRV